MLEGGCCCCCGSGRIGRALNAPCLLARLNNHVNARIGSLALLYTCIMLCPSAGARVRDLVYGINARGREIRTLGRKRV